jgi:hypothetical protein
MPTTNAVNKRVLISCKVIEDGVGDFYHLMDVARCPGLMPNYVKDIFIHTEHNWDTVLIFKKQLEEEGYKVVFVDQNKEGSDIKKSIESDPKKTAFIFNSEIKPNREQNRIITALDSLYKANISISADIFNGEKFEKFTIPKLLITEQRGGRLRDNPTTRGAWLELPMNLQKGTQSIFLTQENREDPVKQLAAVLAKPENHEIHAVLLGQGTPNATDLKSTIAACEQFLKNNLFIPSYLQHNPTAIINFMGVAMNSPLSNGYQSTVFFVNQVDAAVLEQAALQGFLSKKVSKITIKTKTGEKDIINPNAAPNAKPVKLVNGYRIKDDNDYNAIFHCAQYFAGCSGDKTLEKVLSNGLLPFFILHETDSGKIGFLEDAAKFNKQFDYIQHLHNMNNLLFEMLKGIKLFRYDSLSDFQKILIVHKIPESETPQIMNKLAVAIQTGQSFEYAGVTYKLADYTVKDKSQMARMFFYELTDITGKDILPKEFVELRTRFITCASDNNPNTLKEFLKELGVSENATLLAMGNTIADGLRHKKPIKLAEQKFECGFSTEQTEQLVAITIQELIPCVKKHIETHLASISQAMSGAFFKKWSELCTDLQKNQNLHKELPRIAHEFFSKALKEEFDSPQKTAASKPPVTFTPTATAVASSATVPIPTAAPPDPAPVGTNKAKQRPQS